MKITIVINTTEPHYPVGFAMSRLEDLIELVRKQVSPRDDEEGHYPASITDKDLETAAPMTSITATFLGGIREEID